MATHLAAPAVQTTPVHLLPLGDSITDGGIKQRSYRYHLHRMFEAAGQPVQWVGSMHGLYDRKKGKNATDGVVLRHHSDWPLRAQQHEGHWGWTSQQILYGHERQQQRGSLGRWLSGYREEGATPDVALVHLGTNDLTKLVFKNKGEPVAAVARRLHSLTARLCRANKFIRIVLASPIPYCRFGATQRDREDAARRRAAEIELGERIRALAGRGLSVCAGRRHAYVNMSAAVSCDELAPDRVHPAATAALHMANAWHAALQPSFHALRAAPRSSSG